MLGERGTRDWWQKRRWNCVRRDAHCQPFIVCKVRVCVCLSKYGDKETHIEYMGSLTLPNASSMNP